MSRRKAKVQTLLGGGHFEFQVEDVHAWQLPDIDLSHQAFLFVFFFL